MARRAAIGISEVTINGYRRFRLTYPTVDGRKREHFSKRKDAEKRLKIVKDEADRFGRSVEAITGTQRADAVAALRILEGTGLTLVEAARALVEQKRKTESGISIDEAGAKFLNSRENTSETHRKSIATRINYMVRFLAGHTTSSVSAADIQRLIDGLKLEIITKDNYRRCIVSFFNWCMEPSRGWCQSNPALATNPIELPQKEVGILSPEEAAALLAGCHPDILPGVVLGMFCGIRTAELSRLPWRAVDLNQGHVKLGAGITKKNSRRVCPIPDCAKAWLAPFTARAGSVISDNEHNRNLWKLARVRAGFGPFWSQYKSVNSAQQDPATGKARTDLKPWPSNALRHSAISYKLALDGGGLVRIAYESGNNPKTIQAHYNAVADPESARKFFAIMPRRKDNGNEGKAA